MKHVLTILITLSCLACAPRQTQMNSLLDQYLSNSPEEQVQAKAELLKLGQYSTPGVIGRLEESDLTAKRKLTVLLGSLGTPRNEVIAKLDMLAKSEEPSIREAAAIGLGKISPPDRSVVTALTALLEDPEPRVKAAAATSLGSQDYLAVSSVPQLLNLSYEKDAYVSNAALQSLFRLNPAEAAGVAKKSAARIIQRLDFSAPEIRLGSAFLIAKLSTLHKQAEPAVIARLNKETIPVIKAQLASTLLRINSKEGLRVAHPALVELSLGSDADAKRIADQALLYLASLYPQHFPVTQYTVK